MKCCAALLSFVALDVIQFHPFNRSERVFFMKIEKKIYFFFFFLGGIRQISVRLEITEKETLISLQQHSLKMSSELPRKELKV